ncbi:hypothetical protein FB567DRAFT_230461 [Paraphoma chrysanthemicola]|uniref:F-box domain-containing protein n=1 Tax=Paraphoma chrysanthemicola TaxID=798071 RepID=A0A8K0RB92_9PLEO|nr:hypothetical protein FB567DRAFT_230461 [Paraphoma chrysanthemicola]
MDQSTCYIARLPEELLEHILGLLEAETARDIWWKCLNTCRQWHRIGLGLYKGLGFATTAIIESDHLRRRDIQDEDPKSNYPLNIDFNFQPPSELYLSRLRSLTIHVRHQRTATPFRPRPGEDILTTLQSSFCFMPRLTTFSLKFSEGWDFPNLDVPVIPQSLLANLVASLPTTVIDLDLDTAGTDLPPSPALIAHNPELHLCHKINKILTRLRHLRLRTSHICSTLLNFHPNTPPCPQSSTCSHCTSNSPATCHLLRTWTMRTMTIWLPWGQTLASNSFAQSASALLNPTLYNPTTILVIQQSDHMHPDRTSISTPNSSVYDSFTYTPHSNVSRAIRERLDVFAFKRISGHSTLPRPTNSSSEMTASLAQKTTHNTPLRRFYFSHPPSLDTGSFTSHAFLAMHALEAGLAWTQRRRIGARFPIAESDQRGKMYWKSGDQEGGRNKGVLWYCEYPGCGERRARVGLRGHVMYEHGEVGLGSDGRQGRKWGCVSVGCDRVGELGFMSEGDRDEHLRGHYQL